MSQLDPYRTLGLGPGASAAEIKRAYRELAKRYHPDSAGSSALPRFLAVQAAYEALLQWQAGAGGAAARRSPGGTATGGGWRRDPAWARTTHDAGRTRGGRGRTGGPGSGPGDSRGPGDGRAGDGGRDTGPGRAPGAASRQAGGPAGGAWARRARRPANRATFGSTTYDDAEEAEPGWEGGSWYGAGMGTYWTINPREYADPRKHGPEYLARARRAAGLDGPDVPPVVPGEGQARAGTSPPPRASTDRPRPARPTAAAPRPASSPHEEPGDRPAVARRRAAGEDPRPETDGTGVSVPRGRQGLFGRLRTAFRGRPPSS